jgi:hypothetical protein
LIALEKPIGARRTATRVPLMDWTIGQQSGRLPTTNPMGPKSGCLEQAQHDRADKRNCQIGRQDTQPTDDRTDEGHWGTLPVQPRSRCNSEASQAFPWKKVSLADPLSLTDRAALPPTWLKKREINVLMSP